MRCKMGSFAKGHASEQAQVTFVTHFGKEGESYFAASRDVQQWIGLENVRGARWSREVEDVHSGQYAGYPAGERHRGSRSTTPLAARAVHLSSLPSFKLTYPFFNLISSLPFCWESLNSSSHPQKPSSGMAVPWPLFTPFSNLHVASIHASFIPRPVADTFIGTYFLFMLMKKMCYAEDICMCL